VQPGEWVLVLGAGSGVGQAAIQVAALHGARVIATAGSPGKRERATQQLPVEAVLDHHGDLVGEVRALTAGRGADIVVEHVGEATWERSIGALARGGRLVTCGATTGANGRIDLRALFARQISLLGSYMGSKGELARLAPFLFSGRLTPIVDRVFPLAAAAAAQTRLEAREQFGKLVLEV
jgi:NADPH:quinone reductase-like Zn-dependent oxidoreductase